MPSKAALAKRNEGEIHLKAFAAAAAVLLGLFASFTSQAQDATVFMEQGQLIRASRNVTSLGPSLMGDTVNLYTGAVEFHQTDVSLPGNFKLPVSVGRRYVTGIQRRNLYDGLFADWDLEIPHLHGTYAGGSGGPKGWVTWTPTSGDPSRLNRCLNFDAPPTASTPVHAILDPDEFWGGHFLYIPGSGDEKLLLRASDNTTQPLSGGPYPIVTKSNWQVRCGTPLANPVVPASSELAGEGFTAVSPDGTQYRFDWMVSRKYQNASNSTGGMGRQEIWILPTRITDRFGNTVTYTYDTTDTWKLSRIDSSDGRFITFTYDLTAGDSHRVASIFDGTRTWNYTYGTLTNGAKTLTQVLLPDQSTWAFTLNEQGTGPGAGFSPLPGCSGPSSTWVDGTLTTAAQTPTANIITHPSGAIGTFNMAWVLHGRTFPGSGGSPCPMIGGADDLITPVYAVRSLISKTIAGPGLTGSTWAYNWGTPTGSWGCGSSCPTTTTLLVTDARGYKTRYLHGNTRLVNEGQLLQVDEGWDSSTLTAVRTTKNTYRAAGAGPYPTAIGSSRSISGDDLMETRNLPMDSRSITQQGVIFQSSATAFEPPTVVTFVRPISFARSSALASSPSVPLFSKIETTTYSDNLSRWVMSQVASESNSGIEVEATSYDINTALPTAKTSFGKPQGTYTFNPSDGTLSTATDGAGHTTVYSNYMRGLAQNIQYADGTTESATVDNIGFVHSVTNEANTTTSFEPDAMGRLWRITYPSGDEVQYNQTTLKFERIAGDELGLGANHWRQTVTTGNAVTINYFDGLWRKRVSTTFDSTNQAATQRSELFTYDADNRLLAHSFPTTTISSISANLPGTINTYADALGRLTSRAKSNLLPAQTTLAYLDGFTRQTTNAIGSVTTAKFQVFDEPKETALTSLSGAEDLHLSINRDVFGKPIGIVKSGTSGGVYTSVARTYVYDDKQQLCKTIEPELGATLVDWDAANNEAWRSGGTSLTTSSCDRGSVTAAKKITFGYDAVNQLISTTYGDGSPSIVRTYTPDGLPETTVSGGSTWTYTYNRRRLVTKEGLVLNGSPYDIRWHYDANGSRDQVTYPDLVVVDYLPNALGEPTKIGSFATGINRFPNGAISGFAFGNTITHSLTQRVDGLPDVLRDAGIVQDKYDYDANDNVISVTDQQEAGLTTRTMTYDGLDRLRTANGIWGVGSYTYDVQDNLRSSTVGARTATHSYDTQNRLSAVTGTGVNLNYGYDANGNITSRGSQAFGFDLGNRMTQANGLSTYGYDGDGMRTTIANGDGSTQIQVYSQAVGKLMYARNILGSTPATITYSCPAGQTLSGSTCQSTSTTGATVTGYTCPSGYTLAGSTCTQSSGSTSAATPTYSCAAGQTLSGTNCLSTSNVAASPVYSCSAGYSLSGTNCNGFTTAAATATPSCNGHGTLTNSTISSTGQYCVITNYSYKVYPDPEGNCASLAVSFGLVVDNNSSSNGSMTFRCILTPKITYSCPTGATLSGSNCLTPVTVAANISSYTCSSGTLSGNTCVITSSSAATVTYNCPSGQTLSGQTCTLTTTNTTAGTPVYGCPNGGTLTGTSCVSPVSTAATGTYSCPNGGALSGSSCIGSGTTSPESTTKYVYLGTKLVAEVDSVAGTTYIHTDALGSPVARTNATGGLVSRSRFEPYGNVASGFNPTRPDSIGFTGHVNDANTGATYMQARYFDPLAGRFLSVDPVLARLRAGDNFNRYEYANSSPYRYIDPDGQDPWYEEPPPPPEVSNLGTVTIVGTRLGSGFNFNSTWFPRIGGVILRAGFWEAGLLLFPSSLGAPACEMQGAAACGAMRSEDAADDEAPPEAGRKKGGDKAEDDEVEGGHTKGARPSTRGKHQKGDGRRMRDQKGEKKDARNKY